MPSLVVNTSTNDAELVAAPTPNCFIRVKGLDLTAEGDAGEVSLKSNSTVIWRTSAMDATGANGIVLNVDSDRDLDCLPGEALNIGISGSATIKGTIVYVIKGAPPA